MKGNSLKEMDETGRKHNTAKRMKAITSLFAIYVDQPITTYCGHSLLWATDYTRILECIPPICIFLRYTRITFQVPLCAPSHNQP